MEKVLLLFALSFIIVQCTSEEDPIQSACECSTPATIKDLTGLDGCGFIFELEDGTRIEPMAVFECGTGLPGGEQITTARSLEWTDGMTVRIDYELMNDQASYCMAGKIARITCLCSHPESSAPHAP